MDMKRSSGILLHITSLPGEYGTGTIGNDALQFMEQLVSAGQKYWQILPIGPVSRDSGYSPYASTSTFAGNPLFINLKDLAGSSWSRQDIEDPGFPESDFIDFEAVIPWKNGVLEQAFMDFRANAGAGDRADFDKFRKNEEYWLDDYSLFSSLAEKFGTCDWLTWEKGAALRDPHALDSYRKQLSLRMEYHSFLQYVFFMQWYGFKINCVKRGIRIIGDIPVYVTMEGADAWSHPDILQVNRKTGRPVAVAGVPPDYFSETGQRWGNPLYRWEDKSGILNSSTVSWWARRISHLNRLVDIIRIDHFRGFEAYWTIPAGEKTAVNGKWTEGPGIEFFHKLRQDIGDLPLIAEDLGVITPAVEKLRDDLGLPGMKILQFAFDFNSANPYLPHNYDNSNTIVYTGTHDNNTTNGWFYGPETDENTRHYIMEYMASDNFSDFHWQLIRLACMSTAKLVIFPAQDLLGYGSEFRMNTPATGTGNWLWKLRKDSMSEQILSRLYRLCEIYSRL